jgi:hypothetical protein
MKVTVISSLLRIDWEEVKREAGPCSLSSIQEYSENIDLDAVLSSENEGEYFLYLPASSSNKLLGLLEQYQANCIFLGARPELEIASYSATPIQGAELWVEGVNNILACLMEYSDRTMLVDIEALSGGFSNSLGFGEKLMEANWHQLIPPLSMSMQKQIFGISELLANEEALVRADEYFASFSQIGEVFEAHLDPIERLGYLSQRLIEEEQASTQLTNEVAEKNRSLAVSLAAEQAKVSRLESQNREVASGLAASQVELEEQYVRRLEMVDKWEKLSKENVELLATISKYTSHMEELSKERDSAIVDAESGRAAELELCRLESVIANQKKRIGELDHALADCKERLKNNDKEAAANGKYMESQLALRNQKVNDLTMQVSLLQAELENIYYERAVKASDAATSLELDRESEKRLLISQIGDLQDELETCYAKYVMASRVERISQHAASSLRLLSMKSRAES